MTRHQKGRKKDVVVAAVLVGTLLAPVQPGHAQILVTDLANLAENIVTAVQQTLSVAQEIQMVTNQATQIAQQIQQLENEYEMLANMLTNTTPGATVAWGEVDTALRALARTIETGLALSYAASDIARVFEERYPGYEPPQDWPSAYESWSRSALDTLRGTLASAGENLRDVGSVQQALDRLRSQNEATEGRLEAIQIGNQLASLEVEELAKLRQLVAAQINAQNAYLGAQEAKAAGSEAAFDAWVSNGETAIPVSRPSEGLGTVPRP
jgi:P-type conjugative transfer protein TrbJ